MKLEELPYRRCVGILLLNRAGLVWTGRRVPKWAGDSSQSMWQMPQGGIDEGEAPVDAAMRELEEETGLKIRLTSFFEVYTGVDDPRSNSVLLLYLADIIGGELKAADDALDVRWFSLDNPPDKIAFESHVRALNDYNSRMRGLS